MITLRKQSSLLRNLSSVLAVFLAVLLSQTVMAGQRESATYRISGDQIDVIPGVTQTSNTYSLRGEITPYGGSGGDPLSANFRLNSGTLWMFAAEPDADGDGAPDSIDVDDANNQIACPTGQFFDNTSAACMAASIGFFATGGFAQTACGVGTESTTTGQSTCTDINACAGNPCDNGGVCSDLAAPSTGFLCACADGFLGTTCGIAQIVNCSDQQGSVCLQCDAGFVLSGDICVEAPRLTTVAVVAITSDAIAVEWAGVNLSDANLSVRISDISGNGVSAFTTPAAFSPLEQSVPRAGTQYTVEVSLEGSSVVFTQTVTTPPGLPGPIRNLSATPEVGAVRLSWDPPEDDGGSAITGYNIFLDGVGVETVAVTNTVINLQDTGLHMFAVSAVNSVGESDRSDPLTEAALTPPPEISSIAVTPTDGDLEDALLSDSPIIFTVTFNTGVQNDVSSATLSFSNSGWTVELSPQDSSGRVWTGRTGFQPETPPEIGVSTGTVSSFPPFNDQFESIGPSPVLEGQLETPTMVEVESIVLDNPFGDLVDSPEDLRLTLELNKMVDNDPLTVTIGSDTARVFRAGDRQYNVTGLTFFPNIGDSVLITDPNGGQIDGLNSLSGVLAAADNLSTSRTIALPGSSTVKACTETDVSFEFDLTNLTIESTLTFADGGTANGSVERDPERQNGLLLTLSSEGVVNVSHSLMDPYGGTASGTQAVTVVSLEAGEVFDLTNGTLPSVTLQANGLNADARCAAGQTDNCIALPSTTGPSVEVTNLASDPEKLVFTAGNNTVNWTATVEGGCTVTTTQSVLIHPQVTVEAKDKVISEGDTELPDVGVFLSGRAPNYPYPISYQADGQASTVSIAEGTTGSITRSSLSGPGAINGQTYDVTVIADGSSYSVGSPATHTTRVDSAATQPPFNVTLSVTPSSSSEITPDVTDVNFVSTISELSSASSSGLYVHRILVKKGDSEEAEFFRGTSGTSLTISRTLTAGVHAFRAEVSGEGTETSNTVRLNVKTPAGDSDGDGLSDSVEGTTLDTDGDGKRNYLDTDSDGDGGLDSVEGDVRGCNDLPNYVNKNYLGPSSICGNQQQFTLDLSAFRVDLSVLGASSAKRHPEATTTSSELLSAALTQIQDVLGDNGIPLVTDGGNVITMGGTAFSLERYVPLVLPNDLPVDGDYLFGGGIYDFTISGPGANEGYRIVLPQLATIPANAVYRKLNTTTNVWATFTEDSNNSLWSAPGEPGICPQPGDDEWQPGLIEGSWCVRLIVEDGGPNDDDGEVNQSVSDPGGVAFLDTGNTPPVANPDELTVSTNISSVVDVLSNDTDVDDNNLNITFAEALLGTAVITPAGIDYTPPLDFVGSDTINYSISDGNGGSAFGTAAVTVVANQGPVAVDDAINATSGTLVAIDVLANDSDPEGDTLTIISAEAQNGTITISSASHITYTPNSDFTGDDTITYTIADASGATATATVTATVTAPAPAQPAPRSSGGGGALGWLLLLGLLTLAARRIYRRTPHV